MASRIRDTLYRAMTSTRVDSLALLRMPRGLACRLNETLGRPLATSAELEKRQEARARLAELRRATAAPKSEAAELAPLTVYFERDRNVLALTRIEELLGAKGFAWKRLDVSGDEATLEFVTRQAACEREDLPVVFVAERALGGYEALLRADLSGELARLMRPS